MIVNPVLETSEVPETMPDPDNDDEGCLSVPGESFPTGRADWARVTGLDADGTPITLEGTGLFARMLQHETGIEGEERPLRQWDFVHCPPGANHTIVGREARPAWCSQMAPATVRRARTGAPHSCTRRRSATVRESSRRRPTRRRQHASA